MNLPDSATIDRLCEEFSARGDCSDGTCDSCVIQRAMIHSARLREYLGNALTTMSTAGRPEQVQAIIVACMCVGVMIGMEFEREKRMMVQ